MAKKKVFRTFKTGAIRDLDASKPDFEGYLSPLVMEAFGAYMTFNRKLADGSTRDSDNWQKGIPLPAYMKSGFRHFFDWWKFHRGDRTIKEGIVFAICGLIFNAQGYLHEYLFRHPGAVREAVKRMEAERNKRWKVAKRRRSR